MRVSCRGLHQAAVAPNRITPRKFPEAQVNPGEVLVASEREA